MKIVKKVEPKYFEELYIGDIIETELNKYLVVETSSNEWGLLNLKYMTIKSPTYWYEGDLIDEMNTTGIPTHGGSCFDKVVKIHKSRDCKIMITEYN